MRKLAKNYDVITIAISIACMAFLVIGTIFDGDRIISALNNAKNFTIYRLGWFFILVVAGILFYVLWLAFSKYGSIRMGHCKPQYGWFGYAAMIFCAAMGSCMIFWPSVEWAEYISYTDVWPFGWGINEMARNSLSYSFFHWGLPAWAVYAVGIIPLGYRYYVLKKPGLTLQDSCEGLLGSKLTHGPVGTIINIIFIFGILGGLTITYGTGIPMLSNFLHFLFGTPENFFVDILLIAALTALFSWSALSGIDKGILNLSKLCIIFSGVMLALLLVFGNTGFIVNETLQSLGYHFQNFFSMLFNVGVEETGATFAAEWTVFYWAWWIGLAPVMWIFIVKCSKGRSIRSIILTVLGAGFVADVVFFGVISGNGLSLYKNFDWSMLGSGSTPLDHFFNSWNEFQFITDTLNATTAIPKVIILVWFVGCFLLLVTTMDSSAFTMAAATQRNLGTNKDPNKLLRLFWCLMLSVAPLCILGTDAGTKSCTAVVILSAIPVMIVVIIAVLGSMKWIFRDFRNMTKTEIEEFFMTEEEKLEKEKEAELLKTRFCEED